MKRITIKKRLEKRYTGSKNAKAYQLVKAIADGQTIFGQVHANTIWPAIVSGTGRFTRILDYTYDVRRLLDLLNVKYVFGNDAPRGGKTGNFIRVLHLED